MNSKFSVKILSIFLMGGCMLSKLDDACVAYAMKRGVQSRLQVVPGVFGQVFRGADTTNSTNPFLDSRWAKIHNKWFELLKSGDVSNLDDFLCMYGVRCVEWVYDSALPSLHYAALHGDEKVVKCLLDNGADINLVDAFGRTPLMCAVERFCGSEWLEAVRIMHILCVCGANPDIKCAGGNTVLHTVSSVGNGAWRQIFLNMGADDTIKNDAGFTPSQLFCDYQRKIEIAN